MKTGTFSSGEREHELRTEVRYGETDQMGYAHHSVAVCWFEMGRVGWMRAVGMPYKDLEKQGYLMPVVRLNLRYHKPAHFEDPLVIQTRLIDLGCATVTFENRVLRVEDEGGAEKRVLLVEGVVELACVDRAGRIRRMPHELTVLYQDFLFPGPSNRPR